MRCKGNKNLLSLSQKKIAGWTPVTSSRDAWPKWAAGKKDAEDRAYSAFTELTVMVLPFSVPVTVTLAPACLSSVSSAALSLVSRV